MYSEILITQLNDFVFCPVSIYFHMLYGDTDRMLYQSNSQINGTAAHESVDNKTYSSKKSILTGLDVYCEKYGLRGKIDMFDTASGILTERKRKVKTIYDGYIFQAYAQYYSLSEMGYDVKKIFIHSMADNKNFNIPFPEEDEEMRIKFERLIDEIHHFDISMYTQSNNEKCKHCIYEPACDRGII